MIQRTNVLFSLCDEQKKLQIYVVDLCAENSKTKQKQNKFSFEQKNIYVFVYFFCYKIKFDLFFVFGA